MDDYSRKYFQEALLGIDDRYWDRIMRDLFETKDRFHTWRLELDERFAQLKQGELNQKCYEWTSCAIEWLKQIALDLQFAKDLFHLDDWDSDILEDFMNLLSFTMGLFQGQKRCLGLIKAHCDKLPERADQPVLQASRDIPKEFNEWRTSVNNEVRLLVGALGFDKSKKWEKENTRVRLQDGDKVPAATFLELLIRNEIQRQRREIVSRPVTRQDAGRHTSPENPENATKVIYILKKFRETYEETKRKFFENHTLTMRHEVKGHGHSRTMTIVADAETGILITGATKPIAPDIPIFEDAADNISHMRAGHDFGSIIDDCSKDVWTRFQSIRKELKAIKMSPSKIVDAKEKIRLHEDIVNPKIFTCIPSSTNGIKSWAFGDDFVEKPPCTRCQNLYSDWYLHKKPKSPEEKLAILQQDSWTSAIKYTKDRKYPCSYCAETIAAAKIYAIRHGTFTLILSKDKDEIKASDKVRT